MADLDMTRLDMTAAEDTDKLYDHHRQQLSAMLDGALSPDQARFLLRRLQHDSELAASWERWQVCGEVLRAHAHGGLHAALLPADFSQRVARAIAGEHAVRATAAAGHSKPRWSRWGGGAALAASVAVAALFVARQTPQAPAGDSAQIVAATSAPRSAVPQPQAPADSTAASLATAAALAAVATAQGPRRANLRRSARAQSQNARTQTQRAAQSIETPALIALSASAPTDPATPALTDPFATQPIAASRPWPRALLPEARAVGGVSVSYSSADDPATRSFHPFEPRVSAATPTELEDSAPQDSPQD